jgi:hypothetical protein
MPFSAAKMSFSAACSSGAIALAPSSTDATTAATSSITTPLERAAALILGNISRFSSTSAARTGEHGTTNGDCDVSRHRNGDSGATTPQAVRAATLAIKFKWRMRKHTPKGRDVE